MNLDFLKNHIEKCINNAFSNKSKLDYNILNIDGLSGYKTRHFYNNVCNLDNINYVEIGTWKGSSIISALYKNKVKATCIDNWSEMGGPVNEFKNNLSLYLNKNTDSELTIIEKDCFTLTNKDIIEPIDIFMYDGEHTYESHKKAISYFKDFFAKYVIILVDDWVFRDYIRQGTYDGINIAELKIHYFKEIGLVNTNDFNTSGDTFWNGCGVFICERTDI
jgi:hypothetical protein